MSAAHLATDRGLDGPGEREFKDALDLLTAQLKGARRGFEARDLNGVVGFAR